MDDNLRGRRRLRLAGLSAVLGVGAKGVQLVTLVVTVPLLYAYLGPERYGLWAVLTAINALLAFADLGLGNGLTTLLAQAVGRDDRDNARQLVGGALVAVGWLSGAVCIIGAIMLITLPWERLLGVAGTAAAAEAVPAVAVAIAAIALAIPTGLAARIRLGLQQGHRAALWEGCGQALGLGTLLVAVQCNAGVPVLLIAALAPPLLVQGIHLVSLIGQSTAWLRPRAEDLHAHHAGPVLCSGLMFLIIQGATAIAWSFDAVFCSHLHGPAAASELAVVQRLFVIPTVMLQLALTPLWPAYGEALARGDHGWVAQTFRRSLVATTSAGLFLIAIAPILAPSVLQLWVGPDFTAPNGVVLACTVAVACTALAHASSMLANGSGQLTFQAWCGVALLLATLLAKPVLGLWLGPAGLPWATVACVFGALVIPLVWLGSRLTSDGGRKPPAPPPNPGNHRTEMPLETGSHHHDSGPCH